MTTARKIDTNGWIEIKDNPISKVGVFDYSGKNFTKLGLDPAKTYGVYRSEEALSDPETIESFKLLPWLDDHEMIGPNEDTPAEVAGIHGVVGENVYYEAPYLKANLKVWSQTLANKIENEKKELSLGYNCLYRLEEGVYNGKPYQLVQYDIRGNHMASVREGRTGHDVSVLDEKDEEIKMADENKEESGLTLSSLSGVLSEIKQMLVNLTAVEKQEMVVDEKEDKKEDDKPEKAMDEKEIISRFSRRDTLAKQLSSFIGTFDHSDMTLEEVEKYGVEQLKLQCAKGYEGAMLTGYLAAAKLSPLVKTTDSKQEVSSSQVDKIINGEY